MAENIVKDIGFFKVVHLIPAPNETPCGEALICEMIKEDIVRHQMRYHHDLPAC